MSYISYRNGNYVVYFDTETGNKIRNSRSSILVPAFAENCDVTITNRCDGGCEFCYAGCNVHGKHGNLEARFLSALHPGTELAINGNDLSHPNLSEFLIRIQNQGVFVNVTVNQKHFEKHYNYLRTLQKQGLVRGIGVSLVSGGSEFVRKVKSLKNVIIHVIEGIFDQGALDGLRDQGLDILILGYKTTGRGDKYLDTHRENVETNRQWLRDNLLDIFTQFKTVEFDNLALERLDVQNLVSADMWNKHYMGNDGDFTFFINLVDGYFALNSTSPVHWPIVDDVDEMFKTIQWAKIQEHIHM